MALRADCTCPACRPVTSTLRITSVPLPECSCPCGCAAPMRRELEEAQEVCTRCLPHQEHTFRAARDRVVAQQRAAQAHARREHQRAARASRRTPHAH